MTELDMALELQRKILREKRKDKSGDGRSQSKIDIVHIKINSHTEKHSQASRHAGELVSAGPRESS